MIVALFGIAAGRPKAYFLDNGDPRLRKYRTMEVVEQVGTGMQEHVLREDEQVQDNQGLQRFVEVSSKCDIIPANHYDLDESRDKARDYNEEMLNTEGRGYQAAGAVVVDGFGYLEEEQDEDQEEENDEEQEDEDDGLDEEQREEMQRLKQQREQQQHGANAPLKRKVEAQKAESCQFMLSGVAIVDPPPSHRPRLTWLWTSLLHEHPPALLVMVA